MERPPQRYFCHKCWYVGSSDTHPGCNYFAYPMAHLEQLYIDQLEAEIAKLRASPASAPEGWKLVPVVPTHAILDVMFDAGIDRHDGDLTILYRAILAAAPTPPSTEDRKDAERYRWLRSQQIDLNAPRIGVLRSGIFVGKIPDNVVLSEADADAEIDAAMEGK